MARQGKIARLPHALREQVNTRLLNGESAATVLQWLNAQPAAVAVFKQLFNAEPATEQNLSNWRQAGYAEWLARREKTDSLKTLSAFALDLSKAAGGTIADGAAAITAGHLLEALEALPNLVVTGGSDDAEADLVIEELDFLAQQNGNSQSRPAISTILWNLGFPFSQVRSF